MAVQVTIIGAGPGGYVAAIRAAQRGARVTVVESGAVGGTCLNVGCIPTKTIIASAEALELARAATDFGIDLPGEAAFNLEKICERRDKVVSIQVKGVRALLKSRGVALIEGRASLLSPDVVRVVQQDGTTMDVRSDRVIIATGSRPAVLPGLPFDGESIISSDAAVQLKKIPKSLLIVGAGVIGSEFAFIYRTFGADVTMVEAMPRALSTEDQDMADIIEREFKKRKIKLMTGVKIEGVEKDVDGLLA
ncbi:MAG TPA: FAD-dependent oxidoreductase, partial [Nitrospirota bacterium]|nr:FAD-dependent oxidoreductase [Nitrospirota bacterium]